MTKKISAALRLSALPFLCALLSAAAPLAARAQDAGGVNVTFGGVYRKKKR
jgi:hypothetical protein